jgi:ribosome-associated heat shock protein Hsp15
MSEGGGEAMRIDRLLVYLRFARTRSAAQALIGAHALRRNRQHVVRPSEQVRIGDVLTVALGSSVRVIELIALPDRRGPPDHARSHYREVDGSGLDPKGQNTIAASPLNAGHAPDHPEHRF